MRRSIVENISSIVKCHCIVLLLLMVSQVGIATASDSNPVVGFMLKTMQEERYKTDKRLFEEAVEKLGGTVEFVSAGNDELRQLQQFEEMLDLGVDVIVLQPVNTGTAGALVRLANSQGVRVVGYDSMLMNGPLDAMVMQDSWQVGKLQSEAMVEWFMKRKGSVEGSVALIMGQPGDSNAEAMSRGLLETLAKHPGLNLIAKRSHVGWSPDLARETTESLLVKHNNQVDAFICNNSGLAYGVISALESEGIANSENVFVAGADADLRNVRLIYNGKQNVDIWKKIEPLAQKAAEVALVLAKSPDKSTEDLLPDAKQISNGFTDVPTIITPIVRITKDNLESTIVVDIESGAFTRQQLLNSE